MSHHGTQYDIQQIGEGVGNTDQVPGTSGFRVFDQFFLNEANAQLTYPGRDIGRRIVGYIGPEGAVKLQKGLQLFLQDLAPVLVMALGRMKASISSLFGSQQRSKRER